MSGENHRVLFGTFAEPAPDSRIELFAREIDQPVRGFHAHGNGWVLHLEEPRSGTGQLAAKVSDTERDRTLCASL
jgi:hypothetical protein